ncbi:nuclear transport factor 2 family protein [Metabacillus malikii]|uniref:Ketosteroid isomerase-like protein n=1 Tax=Metabacillus malikii TaxID=1504265 RepID=A0ABT9ZA28_9BACI|nr:nuclear transport factor 2 family protein [Metabacillus malikii]MDQ0229106.1 ketosteroid isomerase-like protein [Metabacillus malikii]
MNTNEIKQLIEKYIYAYNGFDIEGMIKLLHTDIQFRNYTNGVVDTEAKGIEAFRELAEHAANLFTSRCQTITDFAVINDKIIVGIDYVGILAVDLSVGRKAGDELRLKGKSVFQVKDGKIVDIEDYS